MVIFEIIGGLGNQIFQWAAGQAFELENGIAVKYDLGGFDHYQLHHGFELEKVFNITLDKAVQLDIRRIFPANKNRYIRKICAVPALQGHFFNPLIVENNSGNPLDNPIFQRIERKYISGYWQSEQYFNQHQNAIKSMLNFRHPLSGKNQVMAELITGSESVSVHVRRGDYICNLENLKKHGICSIDFYRKAIARIAEDIKNPKFFFFSDDMQWVKNNLAGDYDAVFVDHNKGQYSFFDMQLMSLCQHNIIANSSFSWWAAWLNKNANKIVIAPKHWYANGKSSAQLIPAEWISL